MASEWQTPSITPLNLSGREQTVAVLLGSGSCVAAGDMSAAPLFPFSVITAPSLRNKYDGAREGLSRGTWYVFSEHQLLVFYYFFATSSLQEVWRLVSAHKCLLEGALHYLNLVGEVGPHLTCDFLSVIL